MAKLQERIRVFFHYRPLFRELVWKDIKLKYRRSFLGYFWSILSPLMIMIIMVIVFSNMFRFNIQNYPVYLIIGQTIFNFVSESSNQAMWSITGNAALLKKVYVPKYIFTLSKVTSACVNVFFSLGAMLIVFFVCHVHFNAYMLWIPVIILQAYLFCVGLGMLLSATNVFFRDIQYIHAAFLTGWMYMTPIFYQVEMLPDWLKWIVTHLNPVYSYITQFRTVVLYETFPDLMLILIGLIWAGILLLVGTAVFFKTKDQFILYI